MVDCRLIPDVIDKSCAPDDRVAFVDGRSTVTYGEARAEIARLAAYLVDSGFVPGDVIAVLQPNSWDFARSIFAVVKAGLTAAAQYASRP